MSRPGSPLEAPKQEHTYPEHDFPVNLFKAMESVRGGCNVLLSPFSIAQALTLIVVGSQGPTHDQILKILGEADEASLNKKFDAAKPDVLGHKIQFLLGNRLYARPPHSVLSTYAKAIQSVHGDSSELTPENKKNVTNVNAWVSGITKRRLSKAVTESSSLPDLLVINAVYFRGVWASRFERELVFKSPFYVKGDETVTVDMMFSRRDTPFLSAKEFDCQVLELPYDGNNCSMVLFLPNLRDGLHHMMSQITSENLGKALSNLRKKDKVEVFLPKFHFSQQHEMAAELNKLGITDAFDPVKADLSKMLKTPTGSAIGQLVHDVALEIDEDGTEILAAHAGKVQRKSTICGPEFRVDHPFLFVLVTRPGNVVLFMGAIWRPPPAMPSDSEIS
ncbi:leukocyte elastase inhibitor A-like [Ornithodoros turicata]|uniref:leukocyte elastase inhibitor A-like n=1 Tax=Ornithodoros turicata TaxID=34597 RepID=UPI0031389E19